VEAGRSSAAQRQHDDALVKHRAQAAPPRHRAHVRWPTVAAEAEAATDTATAAVVAPTVVPEQAPDVRSTTPPPDVTTARRR